VPRLLFPACLRKYLLAVQPRPTQMRHASDRRTGIASVASMLRKQSQPQRVKACMSFADRPSQSKDMVLADWPVLRPLVMIDSGPTADDDSQETWERTSKKMALDGSRAYLLWGKRMTAEAGKLQETTFLPVVPRISLSVVRLTGFKVPSSRQSSLSPIRLINNQNCPFGMKLGHSPQRRGYKRAVWQDHIS
jgi:hypothetical protein